jgi:hypothetical protein
MKLEGQTIELWWVVVDLGSDGTLRQTEMVEVCHARDISESMSP